MSEQLSRDIGQPTILSGGNDFSGCCHANNAWYLEPGSASVANNNKHNNSYLVRPVAATPQIVYDIPFSSIIEAWLDCERDKRSSNSCIKFRWHAARDLVSLWESMRMGNYKPHASMVFMVKWPVLREVWAGAFRDRVVHHWEYLRFGPIIENFFVNVGDRSMNCRKGYGSIRAINTMQSYIQEFTDNYSRNDCYIVGGDFANFFMSIDKSLLWGYLEHIIMDEYEGSDKAALIYMMHTTLFHRCQDNFYRRSPIEMWNDLPPRKSLFHMDGLPIGNLPSQIWANFLGAIFTMWIIFVKKVDGFIIFVDDFKFLVRSAEDGRRLIKEIREFLDKELHITLHPDKIYLQHYTNGTKFVGAVIKPPCNRPSALNHIKRLRKWVMRGLNHDLVVPDKFRRFLVAHLGSRPRFLYPGRIYVSNRTRGHFISAMIAFNNQATSHKGRIALLDKLRSSINSYLGLMCHFNSYQVRKKICEKYILPTWGNYLFFEDEFRKCTLRKEYDSIHVLRHKLKNHRFAAKFIRPKWSPV